MHVEEEGLCISLEKDEDFVLVLEKEAKFKIGNLGLGHLRHLGERECLTILGPIKEIVSFPSS